jgi:hypothetical protein
LLARRFASAFVSQYAKYAIPEHEGQKESPFSHFHPIATVFSWRVLRQRDHGTATETVRGRAGRAVTTSKAQTLAFAAVHQRFGEADRPNWAILPRHLPPVDQMQFYLVASALGQPFTSSSLRRTIVYFNLSYL